MISLLNQRSVLVGLLSSVVFSSCGVLGLNKKDSNDEVQNPMLVASEKVMLVSPEDQSCESSENLSSVQIWHWNGNAIEPKTVSMSAQSGSDGELITDSVIGAVHDLQMERDCTLNGNELSCKKATTTNADQLKIVKICRSDAKYGRESVESVTLTSQYMAETALSFYKGLSSSKSTVSKAILVVQPKDLYHITKTSTGEKADKLLSDNAAFANGSKKDSSGVFMIYPTSKKAFAKSPLHLWEVPFVMHHEYGHNIFHLHIQNAADNVGLTTVEAEVSLEGIMRNSPSSSAHGIALSDEETQAQKDLSGLNEMFADLFAYYSGDAVSSQLKGIDGLDKTRDPLSSSTAGGTKKIWTTSESEVFKGNRKPDSSISATEPNFTDSHDVAAVFGYNIATLLNAAMPGKTSAQRANVLIKWLDQLAIHISAKGTSSTLDSMTAELVKVIVSNKTSDLTKACADFSANMSGLPLSVAQCK